MKPLPFTPRKISVSCTQARSRVSARTLLIWPWSALSPAKSHDWHCCSSASPARVGSQAWVQISDLPRWCFGPKYLNLYQSGCRSGMNILLIHCMVSLLMLLHIRRINAQILLRDLNIRNNRRITIIVITT